jgi:hypothetical protein
VLDIFAGSNTTGSKAEKLDRRWLAFEEDRTYLGASIATYRIGGSPVRGGILVETAAKDHSRAPSGAVSCPHGEHLYPDTSSQPIEPRQADAALTGLRMVARDAWFYNDAAPPELPGRAGVGSHYCYSRQAPGRWALGQSAPQATAAE